MVFVLLSSLFLFVCFFCLRRLLAIDVTKELSYPADVNRDIEATKLSFIECVEHLLSELLKES